MSFYSKKDRIGIFTLWMDPFRSLEWIICIWFKMVNLFENSGPSEWLLYISEWEYCGQTMSNIRVTTKIAVHCVLANCPQLKNLGTMLLYNIAIKEVKTVVSGGIVLNCNLWKPWYLDHLIQVFDDVAVELTMAILQFFQSDPNEEQIFRTCKALMRFLEVINHGVES